MAALVRCSPSKYKKCDCGIPMARLTSWTKENPGRKFLTCKFYDPKTETRGCKSFEWVDEDDGTDWQRDVINQLILDKKLMKGEISSLKTEVEDLNGQRRCLLNEIDNLKLKCRALNGDRKRYSNEGKQSSNWFGCVPVGVVFCFVLMMLGLLVVVKVA